MSNIKNKINSIKSSLNSVAEDAGKTTSWLRETDDNGVYQNFKDAIDSTCKALKSPQVIVMAVATTIGSAGIGAHMAHEEIEEAKEAQSQSSQSPQRQERISRRDLMRGNVDDSKTTRAKASKQDDSPNYTAYMVGSVATANSLLLLSALGTATNRRRIRNELNQSTNDFTAE